MDVKTEGSESGEVKSSPASVFKMPKKSCIDCHTTRTPLWRGGPAGPRSLCNACGIRYRKVRRALSALDRGKAEKSKRKSTKNAVSLKIGLMTASAGRDLTMEQSLEEEEEAAILLMSLSFGYINA